jgi:hypothetical protein
MSPPIRTVDVAAFGLDLLHQTRLKLACSLLLAQRLDATLQPWNGSKADLLVIGIDEPGAAAVLARAREMDIPSLIISRHVDSDAADQLAHGAAVASLNQKLSALLAVRRRNSPEATPPLLLQLAQTQAPVDTLYLLQCGALQVVIDPVTRSLALPANLGLLELVAQLDDSRWASSHLSRADFNHPYRQRLPQRQSLEALFFCLVRHRPQLLPTGSADTVLQLEHWPDLWGVDLPAGWLLAVACLHARPWQANALAAHCQIPVSTVNALFAAAAASGLAQAATTGNVASHPGRHREDSRFFSWVARRFGLTLFKTAHA